MPQLSFTAVLDQWVNLVHSGDAVNDFPVRLATFAFVGSLPDRTDSGVKNYPSGNSSVTLEFDAAPAEDTPKDFQPANGLEALLLSNPGAYKRRIAFPKVFVASEHITGLARLMTLFHTEYRTLPTVELKGRKTQLLLSLYNSSLKRTVRLTFAPD